MEQAVQKLALSVPEAAKLLSVSKPTMYALIHRDDFPSFSVGGRRLISVEGLRRWVAERAGGAVG